MAILERSFERLSIYSCVFRAVQIARFFDGIVPIGNRRQGALRFNRYDRYFFANPQRFSVPEKKSGLILQVVQTANDNMGKFCGLRKLV